MDINLQIVYLCNNFTICNNNYFTPESNCSLKKKKRKKSRTIIAHSFGVGANNIYIRVTAYINLCYINTLRNCHIRFNLNTY